MTENLTFHALELGVLLFACLFVREAYRQRGHWLATLLWGVMVGFGVEFAIVHVADRSIPYYVYDTQHFVTLLGVPACVSVGWGLVLYASLWVARQWSDQPLKQALIAGGVAVNIDFSLEGVAQHLGFWVWSWPDGAPAKRIDFFGIPYDNFNGWFGIVSLFALYVCLGLRRKPAASWIVPLVSTLLTIATLALARSPVVKLYEALGANGTGHIALLSGLLLASLWALASSRPPAALTKVVLALVLFFHGYALGMVFVHPALAAVPGLAPIVAFNAIIGAGIHLVPLWSRMRSHQTASRVSDETSFAP